MYCEAEINVFKMKIDFLFEIRDGQWPVDREFQRNFLSWFCNDNITNTVQ